MKIGSFAFVRLCCVCDAEAKYQCVICGQYFCTPNGCPRQRRTEQHSCVRLEESAEENGKKS